MTTTSCSRCLSSTLCRSCIPVSYFSLNELALTMLRYIVIALYSIFLASCKELVQVNLVWRHGDRSSGFQYPNDPYKDVWKDGPMQLTEIGMKQEYELGLFLRGRYGHLVGEKYNLSEIYIRSTDTDRSIMSAQCVVGGLYAPANTTEWQGIHTPWRPFPIHVVASEHDWLLKVVQYPEKGCKNYDALMQKLQKSDWYVENAKTYGDFYRRMTKLTGVDVPFNISSIRPFHDNLFCLQSHGYALPQWISEEDMKTLAHLRNIDVGLRWTDVDYKYRKTISKMRSGIILQKMLENMQKFVNGTDKRAVFGYSAHDSVVTPLLVSMGDWEWVNPTYSACVILELYKEGDTFSVEFKFRNLSRNDPYELSFFGCEKGCSFEEFLRIASDVIPGDSSAICGIESKSFDYAYLAIGLGAVLFSLLIFVTVKRRLHKKEQKPKHDYERLSLNEVENGLFPPPL